MKSWVARETVTRRRPTYVEDRDGNKVADWSTPNPLDIPGCLVAPGTTVENEIGRDAISDGWTIYAPPSVDVEATDVVVVRGTPYSVSGTPARWPAGTIIVVSRSEG